MGKVKRLEVNGLQEQDAFELVPFASHFTDDLVAMWRASFEFGVEMTDPHPIEEQRDYLLNELVPNNNIRVAMVGNTLVGFVAASAESITQLYVHVNHHRRGIGSRMLNWAKSQSSGKLWLYTFQRNTTAQRFYESHGFNIIERGFETTWQLEDLKYEWIGD